MRPAVLFVALALPAVASAQPAKPENVDECVRKGLDWLRKQQLADGHWEATGGQYPTVWYPGHGWFQWNDASRRHTDFLSCFVYKTTEAERSWDIRPNQFVDLSQLKRNDAQ